MPDMCLWIGNGAGYPFESTGIRAAGALWTGSAMECGWHKKRGAGGDCAATIVLRQTMFVWMTFEDEA
jgi:hypothetical protein